MSGLSRWFTPPTVEERLSRFDLRPDLLAAAKAMASDARSDVQVVRLQAVLTGTETVLRLMDARHGRARGMFALTSERILFRPARGDQGAFSVPLADVVAIEAVTHRLSGTVNLTTNSGRIVVDQILGTQGEMLADDAREAIRGGSAPARDPLELLAELRALRDSGAVSAAEFEIRKAAIWREI